MCLHKPPTGTRTAERHYTHTASSGHRDARRLQVQNSVSRNVRGAEILGVYLAICHDLTPHDVDGICGSCMAV